MEAWWLIKAQAHFRQVDQMSTIAPNSIRPHVEALAISAVREVIIPKLMPEIRKRARLFVKLRTTEPT